MNKRLEALYFRDERICHICGYYVMPDFEIKELGPSADHIIAKSKGATRKNNIKLAHQFCNVRKGVYCLGPELKERITDQFVYEFVNKRKIYKLKG